MTDRPDKAELGTKRRVVRRRKKVCAFCVDKTNACIDYQ